MSFNGLNESQISSLKQAFDLCDINLTWKIDISLLLDSLHCLDYDNKSKLLFEAIKELDDDKIRQEGLSFEVLVDAINNKIYDKDEGKQCSKVFNILKNDSTNNNIDLNKFKEIIHEMGSYIPDEEIKHIIANNSESKNEITLKDFSQLLIK